MANNDPKTEKKLPTLNKLPPMNFGGKSMFSGGKNLQGGSGPGSRFIPPQIRITQSKGAGGK